MFRLPFIHIYEYEYLDYHLYEYHEHLHDDLDKHICKHLHEFFLFSCSELSDIKTIL